MYKEAISVYTPKNVQEKRDKEAILQFIEKNDDVLERSNLAGHITSSAIVTNKAEDKVLFAYHNIYDSWSWVGGHNDGDPDLLKVAIKETKEETGVQNVVAKTKDILALDVVHVTNHYKNGEFVPDHLHFNVTYHLIASEDESLQIKADENSGVRWFKMDEVLSVIDEVRMRPIYEKVFKQIGKTK
jgi:ADP-ribose pyrophosphatase YjhB (NUDIX family)